MTEYLTITEYEPDNAFDLEAELEKLPERADLQKISNLIEGEDDNYLWRFPREEEILLRLLMGGTIGTSSQRGSVTRILNTLKDKFTRKPSSQLMKALARHG